MTAFLKAGCLYFGVKIYFKKYYFSGYFKKYKNSADMIIE
jgi:hypothetical protein